MSDAQMQTLPKGAPSNRRPKRGGGSPASAAVPGRIGAPDARALACGPIRNDTDLQAHLDLLAQLGAPELRAEWTRVYDRPAPGRISRDMLVRGIAYRIQEQMYGGLKPATIKRLKQIAATLKEGRDVPKAPKPEVHPGSRLIREWKGQTHIVEALPDGFAWRGKTYRSLTQIARLITGMSWSGPMFFGLRDKRSRATPETKLLAERLK